MTHCDAPSTGSVWGSRPVDSVGRVACAPLRSAGENELRPGLVPGSQRGHQNLVTDHVAEALQLHEIACFGGGRLQKGRERALEAMGGGIDGHHQLAVQPVRRNDRGARTFVLGDG